jgi:hypothetical protein
MSVIRPPVTAARFAAAILAGAAAGLLGALLYLRTTPDPAPAAPPIDWPTALRCGASMQPEDLDRADRCGC